LANKIAILHFGVKINRNVDFKGNLILSKKDFATNLVSK
jgi:hypothetical protein